MKPLVSIVIPLYNKERHIGRSIGSVLSQTFQDFEIVVVDDGSSDDGPRLVERIGDPRIRVIRQENHGVSVARNRGAEEAAASLIAFLDADDEYKPGFLAWALERFHERPDVGAVAFNYEVVYDDKTRRSAIMPSETSKLLGIGEYCRLGRQASAIFSSSVMVKREILRRIGGFPKGVKAGEDIDTWLRIIEAGAVFFDSRLAAVYHCDADNRASLRNTPAKAQYFFKTLNRVVGKTPDLTPSELRDVAEFKNMFLLGYSVHQIRYLSASEGRSTLLNCDTRVFRGEKWKWIMISLLPHWFSSWLRRLKNGRGRYADRNSHFEDDGGVMTAQWNSSHRREAARRR